MVADVAVVAAVAVVVADVAAVVCSAGVLPPPQEEARRAKSSTSAVSGKIRFLFILVSSFGRGLLLKELVKCGLELWVVGRDYLVEGFCGIQIGVVTL